MWHKCSMAQNRCCGRNWNLPGEPSSEADSLRSGCWGMKTWMLPTSCAAYQVEANWKGLCVVSACLVWSTLSDWLSSQEEFSFIKVKKKYFSLSPPPQHLLFSRSFTLTRTKEMGPSSTSCQETGPALFLLLMREQVTFMPRGELTGKRRLSTPYVPRLLIGEH